MRRGYIAGPMTGYDNYNFLAFFEAEARLTALFPGAELVNPARHDEEMGWVTVVRDGYGGILSATKREDNGFTWGEALDWDLGEIATCDFIYLLPGWQASRGATREFEFAFKSGLQLLGDVHDGPATAVVSEPLLGLIGYARSGKDTFAAALGYDRIAFADPLKELALYVNPLIDTGMGGLMPLASFVAQVGWDRAKETAVNSPQGTRPFLQDLGVGVRNTLGADTWVDAALAKYDPSRPTAITDVRFPNEVAAIRDRGGLIVRITRTSLSPPNKHVSEELVRDIVPDYDIEAPWFGVFSLHDQAKALNEVLRGKR